MFHIQYCSLCGRLDLRTKSLSVLSGSLCITYEISLGTRFSKNSHSTTRCLKHSSNFESAKNVRSSNVVEFEFRHIPNHPNVRRFLKNIQLCAHLRTVNEHSSKPSPCHRRGSIVANFSDCDVL